VSGPLSGHRAQPGCFRPQWWFSATVPRQSREKRKDALGDPLGAGPRTSQRESMGVAFRRRHPGTGDRSFAEVQELDSVVAR
jgi:hypothetical protein